MIPTLHPWTHTSDDSYMYQLSLVVATATAVSFVFWYFFFVALISRVAFFCCALVPGTLAHDLPTLILQRVVFLCLTVCDHIICISLG